jgi:hypothetical protein
MEILTTLTLMVNASILTLGATLFFLIRKQNQNVIDIGKDAVKTANELAAKIVATHNEQVESVIKLAKRVEDIRSEMELRKFKKA